MMLGNTPIVRKVIIVAECELVFFHSGKYLQSIAYFEALRYSYSGGARRTPYVPDDSFHA